MKEGLSRRTFVKSSVLGSAGLLASNSLFAKEEKVKKVEATQEVKIKRYYDLGKTGFKVSDICLGYSNNVPVIQAALDAGVNYIDTAESYRNQPAVGKAIKGRDRKSIFITSKMLIEKKTGLDKEGFIKRFNQCLKELQTDYIDCMMIHSADSVEVMNTPGFHAAMDQMKKEKKLRFVGISNHGTMNPMVSKETMETILTAAANDGRFSVFLLTYNFIQNNHGKKILDICKKKGIGTTIMKVNPVGTYNGIKKYLDRTKKAGKKPNKLYADSLERFKKVAEKGEWFAKKYKLENSAEIRDAAIRFVLTNPDAHSVTCSMRNFDQIDQFIKLSGSDLSAYDKKTLANYKDGCSQLYCRHACGECHDACPENVPVNTIMRYNHYYSAQGKEKFALKKYMVLDGPKADLCQNCEGFCESSCSYGLPIQGMLNMAHSQLTLA